MLSGVIKDILSGKFPLELFLETLKFEFSFDVFIAAQCWIVDRIIRPAEECLDSLGGPGAITHRSCPGSTRLFNPAFLGSREENFYSSAEFFSVVPKEIVVHHSTTDATASSQSAGPYSGLKNSLQIL